MRALKRLIAIVGGGIVGIVLLVFGVKDFMQTKALQSKGKSVTGEVTDAEVSTGRRGRKRYYVTVNFEAEGGKKVSSRERVSRSEYEEANSSGKVNVIYLPTDPTVCRVGAAVETELMGMGVGAVVLGCAAMSAFRRAE